MSRHPAVAAYVGGPADGDVRRCPMFLGLFLADGFADPQSPEGRYELDRVVQHGDGSLCGGVYRWTVTRR